MIDSGTTPSSADFAAKLRLAAIASAAGRNFEAHTLLKECLKADESNLTLRTAYSQFLINISSFREALTFTEQTIKRYSNPDSATWTALAHIQYQLGREARSTQEVAERPKQYLRSAEAYRRALEIDPRNAIAAQGLAVALAEDTLLPRGTQTQDDSKERIKLAGQALAVFGRIGDSVSDGSVAVNTGHCYFVRGEEEKAIQAVSIIPLAIDEAADQTVRDCQQCVRRSQRLRLAVSRSNLVCLRQSGI